MPVVKVGLFIFAFCDIWFAMVTANEGSLLIAAFISTSALRRVGLAPTRDEIALSTYPVLAIWVVFVFGEAVGACGSPVNIGEDNGAFVTMLLCKEAMLLSSVTNALCIALMFVSSTSCLLVTVASELCKALMLLSSTSCLLFTVASELCKVLMLLSSTSCLLVTVASELCKVLMLLSSTSCLLVTVARFVCSIEMLLASTTSCACTV